MGRQWSFACVALVACLGAELASAQASEARPSDTDAPLTHAEVVIAPATPSDARSSAATELGTHPDWGVFTTGALSVGVAYTVAWIFGAIGDTYGYSGILAIPLGGGFAYAALPEQQAEAIWRGALLSASQLLGLAVWIAGMAIHIPDAPRSVSAGDLRLMPGPGDLGVALVWAT